MAEKLDADKIKRYLKTDFIGSKIVVLNHVDSTQDYALNNLPALNNGTMVIAESQNKGKGRLGRVWHSTYGKGIYMSLVLKDSFKADILPQVTLLGSLSLTKYLKTEYDLNFQVRWPNDVVIKHAKIAGVLAIMRGGIIVIGIGINVNQNLQELPEAAASLFLLLGKDYDRNKITACFLNCLEEDFYCWKNEGHQYLRKLWLDFAYLKGQEVVARTNSGIVKGVVEDLACDCGLIIRGSMGFHIELNVNDLINIREISL